MAPPLELRTYHEGPALYRFLQSSDFCNRISLRFRGGFVVTVAAISTISPGVPSARFLSRHQPYKISGRSVRENATANRACVCGDARVRSGRNRQSHGLQFPRHAVAVTGVGSDLDKHAGANGWLARFPMPDWIGGRTSVMSAVGLLPMALQGFDIDAFLAGAAAMDERTRVPDVMQNAAMLLALMWHYAGDGKGGKDMVVLPYKDRLALFTKYLQQLVMESLGKEKNLAAEIVHQGIAVYGNKGSTDQHSYLQQLRDGVLNFFVTFVEVRNDRRGARFEVEDGITSGDYLEGFLRGSRNALYEKGRESITMSIPEVNAFYIGALIALYERAVGFYGSLVNINAYDQPGVEAGKKAASKLLQLQKQVCGELSGEGKTAEEIARSVDADPEDVFHLLRHLASNDARIKVAAGDEPADDRFSLGESG